MNLIEKIKRLAELERKMHPAPWGNCYWHKESEDAALVALRNAASSMLAVLGAFQPGDARVLAETLSFLISESEESDWQDAIDCLTRLQKAARLMEATQ